jgi:acetyl-CoA acetyltransferase
MPQVEIVGAGLAGSDGGRPSHAELLYRATRAALDDAGLEREAITTAVTSSYDFVEGRPLSNQFTLDSIGGTMKPCDLRVGDDGIHALAAGVSAALADPGAVVVVGAVQLRRGDHSEETYRRVQELSYEPVWQRPILAGARNPEALAFGMRAQRYMALHGTSEDDLANLVSRRSSAGNGTRRNVDEILESPVIAGPLRELHVAPPTDVAATVLVSTDPPGGRSRGTIRGVGWSAVDAMLPARDLAVDEPTARAAADAYAELYNVYGIDELQALEALGLASPGGAIEALRPGQGIAVNPDGATQRHGWAPGAASIAATVRALDELGKESDPRLLVTQGWTGCGGCSAAVAVIDTNGGSR